MSIQAVVVDLGGVLLEIVDWRKWEQRLDLAKGDLMKFADHLEVQALWSDNEMFQPPSAMMGNTHPVSGRGDGWSSPGWARCRPSQTRGFPDLKEIFYYRSTTNAFPKKL